jgi:alkylation response protein AidB-like acyl-CoA dehydrogenase
VDFQLTDEQEQLRRSVRKFAEAEIAPHVMEWDEASHFPQEIIPQLGAMGLLGVIFPEKYGGAGLGYMEYAIAVEELSRVDGSVGIIVAAHNSLCTNHIYKFGTEEQRQKYLVPLAQGKKLGAWSLTEPEAGSDAGGTKSSATRKDGGWILNGAKTFTTNGHYAAVCVAMAVTDKSKKSHGISAFIIEKGAKGFRPGKKENKLGLRASDTSEVIFDDCFVSAENLLGTEGEGFVNSLQILDGGRISIGALALGMAQGAFEAATKYAKQRKQFGKPIADFQAIQFKLADMATEIEAARCLL